MFSFIKRHWIVYLVGAVVALALGFALAYAVGVAGSTPEAVRVERNEAEQTQDVAAIEEELENLGDSQDSDNDDSGDKDASSTDDATDQEDVQEDKR